MVAIPSRHKSLVLLAGVILAQVLALAIQIKAKDAQGDQGSLIRSWTVGAISPFARAGSWTVGKIRGTWRHYFALSDAAKENERLRRENDSLKLRVNELQSKAEETARLAALLHFRESHRDVKMIPARVIGASADASSAVIFVDRGQRDGLRKNMGVITPDGVVGKVVDAYGDTAQILLLTDKDSGVGAMLANSRVQSPVGGTGEPLLNMKYVASDDEVNVGDQVVTSGMDRIFPKDLPIGTVAEVKQGTPFKQIRVRPAAKLERLEEVLILPTLESFEMLKNAPADTADAKSAPSGPKQPSDAPAFEKRTSSPNKPAAKPAPQPTDQPR